VNHFNFQVIKIRCVDGTILSFRWKSGNSEAIQNIMGGKMVEVGMKKRKVKPVKPEKFGLQPSDFKRLGVGGMKKAYSSGQILCRPGPVCFK
jgi:hypothetical protein